MAKNGVKWPEVPLTRDVLANVPDETKFNELPQGKVELLKVACYKDPMTPKDGPERVVVNALWKTEDGFSGGPISKKSILEKLIDGEGKVFQIEGEEISEA